MTSQSIDPAAAASARPPELAHDTIWRDGGYLLRLIGGYLRADPWIGSLLLVVTLGVGAGTGGLLGLANFNLITLTDALVARNAGAAAKALFATLLIYGGALVMGQGLQAAIYVFRWRWRATFTRRFIARWMTADRFYHLQREHRVDNPEQRIQEDLFAIAESVIELGPELISSIAVLAFSLTLLWKVSHPLSLAPIGLPLIIPADLMTFALVLGVLWTVGSHYIGRPITSIEVTRQRLEADFRHDLGQVREHGEAIAFERGGERERARALGLFHLIGVNWRRYVIAHIRLGLFNELLNMVTPRVLPVLLSMPHILAGEMTVGQMGGATIAFTAVLGGLAFFARIYGSIATLRAGVARVRLFDAELDRPLAGGLVVTEVDEGVTLRDVSIDLPDGRRLVDVPHLDVAPGDRVLVRGRSGAGKSTLLRALAGLWPYGSGQIGMPSRDRAMFLPQRAYMPSGTLAALLSYPGESAPADRERYVDVLRRLSLEAYVDRLDEYAEWRRILSPGEQQRVAAARALLRAPDFLFLDEATSGLDMALETDVYRALAEISPMTAIVSVAHRPTVARFHGAAVDIEGGLASPAVTLSPPDPIS